MRGVRFDADVERRLVSVGHRNRPRGVVAKGARPARHQPVGRIARGGLGEDGVAVLRNAAQYGVDQPGIARGAAVGLRQPHGEIDRGVVRHVEPEQLRRADEQDGLGARCVTREALVEEPKQRMAQRAEAAQHGRGQSSHQGAVAIGQRGEAEMRVAPRQLLVEGHAPAQNAVDDVGGDFSGG